MDKTNKTTLKDMELLREWASPFFLDSEKIPIEYKIGGVTYKGIPKNFNPTIRHRIINANIIEHIYVGVEPDSGIEVKVELFEYKDFPVIEWTAFFAYTKSKTSKIIKDVFACKSFFSGSNMHLHYGNGDFYSEDGLRMDVDIVNQDKHFTFKPKGGRPCDQAFPYYRVACKDYGYNLSIGWPGQWQADFVGMKDGFEFSAKQEYTHFYLNPNEIFRTPRMTVMSFAGDIQRGANLWRRWYMEHVLPRTQGNKLQPKLITHVFGGGEEFTLADENNQIEGIKTYLERGLKFDIWWIDAGWYPCKDQNGTKRWVLTGNWIPDPEKFPNGLAPIGKLCEENDIQFLLWFEPERIVLDHWPKELPHEYLLKLKTFNPEGVEVTDGTALLDLGNSEARKWITDRVNTLIKESHIKVYRQDFNRAPLDYWLQNETEDRRGTTENFYIQGYLQYWDDLLINNPDLWIDSCASGGRRNDLETMRRAVPLQYTDYGLGVHPIKQSFNYTMFSWLPYFRNHTWSWDDIDGNYFTDKPKMPPVDNYGYHSAMAPSLTCMVTPTDDEAVFNYAIKMNDIWKKAAKYMQKGDYYPLLPYSKKDDSYYSVQFHIEEEDKGIIQGIRNLKCTEEAITVFPKFFDTTKTYLFENPEFDKSLTIVGSKIIKEGFTFNIPIRSGEIWFYSVI